MPKYSISLIMYTVVADGEVLCSESAYDSAVLCRSVV